MQKEHKAEKLFIKYKNKYIKVLGRHTLDNTEIDNLCKKEFGSRYKGSFAQNEKFPLKSGMYIINTDIASGPGVHWVSMYITPKTAYIHDSFARKSQILVKHLTKRLSEKKIKIINSDTSDKEQQDHQIICGHISIAWLAVVQNLGIRYALHI